MRKNKIILNHLPPEEPDDKDKIPTKELILSAAKAAKDTFETERNYQVSEFIKQRLEYYFGQATNLIAKFTERALKIPHIFSEKHIKSGIMELGKNQDDILNKFLYIIKELNLASVLSEGSNHIEVILGNKEATLRLYVNKGIVENINIFTGFSSRILGNYIDHETVAKIVQLSNLDFL